MNSVVEITDMLGTDFYYVSVAFKGNQMMLEKPKGCFVKAVDEQIHLSKITHVCARKEKGIETLSFFYDRNWYRFIDYGNNSVSQLKRRLAVS